MENLTTRKIENAIKEVAREGVTGKAKLLEDGDGLRLLIKSGARKVSKRWQLQYKRKNSEGRTVESTVSLGAYSDVSLDEARAQRARCKNWLRDGLDPVQQMELERQAARKASESTFEAVARDWLEFMRTRADKDRWTPAHHRDCRQRLEKHAFPHVGKLPIRDIEPKVLADRLKAIQNAGTAHMAGRIHTLISQVYQHAIAHGLTFTNPARDVGSVVAIPTVTHQPALKTASELAVLLNKIDGSQSDRTVKLAVRLLALTALRTKELRLGRWVEVDFDAATWTIPGTRMKGKGRPDFVVPLSTQAVDVLRDLHAITGSRSDGLIFPGLNVRVGRRRVDPHLSESTLNLAIQAAGYKDRHSGHGCRRTFSTVMNEAGYDAELIEFCLAHSERNKARAAYNAASYVSARRPIMQQWADFLSAAASGNVVAFRASAAVQAA